MKMQIIDNRSIKMAAVLPSLIEQSRDIKVAVAFMSRQGLSLIERSIDLAVSSGAYIEFLVGLDMNTTEPGALQFVHNLSRNSTNVDLYCYAHLEQAAIYHPKVYLFRAGDKVNFIVGSSNLTMGGLNKNIEINMSVEASAQDEVVSDIFDSYNELKFHQDRVAPDDEFISLYTQVHDIEKDKRNRTSRDKATNKLIKQLNEKAKSLQRPKPTQRDLVGWLELVYDALPEDEFTNQQVYDNEHVFERQYPYNLNIKPKVRQQLQVLRDMGLIEHLGRGRWRKL